MSRILEVIKNKNKIEKAQIARRKEELSSLRAIAAYKARLYDELKVVDVLLDSGEVESVVVSIPDEFISNFGMAIYGEELAEYNIEQIENEPNQFVISRKFIQF